MRIVSLTVVHNHARSIGKLIDSIERSGFENAYFCDAASTDNSFEILNQSKFSSNTITNSTLYGFSKNNNDLIRAFELDPDYFMLLNPDAYVDSDVFTKCVEYMDQNPDVGVLCPQLYYPNGEIQKSWKAFPKLHHGVLKRLGLRSITDEKIISSGNIDWALGACLVVRRELMLSPTKLLDERYRLYCEDVDVCFNAKVKGFKVVGTEEINVFHELQESSSVSIFSKYNYWNLCSMIKFLLKWNLKYVFRN
ncbi:glycosyltransferase [Persicobacter psychrovividus]|uniref:Glycosyl transferase family 2 n=1 Tax=Persicobacter psychrovividus TaxID=387638 RepID=A0ABM7VGA8_9BACT|nr:glycosyl transferase family 2 [Persicobacter psychrovividus]